MARNLCCLVLASAIGTVLTKCSGCSINSSSCVRVYFSTAALTVLALRLSHCGWTMICICSLSIGVAAAPRTQAAPEPFAYYSEGRWQPKKSTRTALLMRRQKLTAHEPDATWAVLESRQVGVIGSRLSTPMRRHHHRRAAPADDAARERALCCPRPPLRLGRSEV